MAKGKGKKNKADESLEDAEFHVEQSESLSAEISERPIKAFKAQSVSGLAKHDLSKHKKFDKFKKGSN